MAADSNAWKREVADLSARIIVVANEKGGSGKTTVSMHLAIGLMLRGLAVGTIDLDHRQRSLTRYLENRRGNLKDAAATALPLHRLIAPSGRDSRILAESEDCEALERAIGEIEAAGVDLVVIDCAAGINPLSRFAHFLADVLVTPLNDSFVDLDPLIHFGPPGVGVTELGSYFQMLWQVRRDRRQAGRPDFSWVVLRNRLSGLADQNKRQMGQILEAIAPMLGFHLVGGLGERIVFRQLFREGLTVFDEAEGQASATASHRRAAAELDELIDALPMPAGTASHGLQ